MEDINFEILIDNTKKYGVTYNLLLYDVQQRKNFESCYKLIKKHMELENEYNYRSIQASLFKDNYKLDYYNSKYVNNLCYHYIYLYIIKDIIPENKINRYPIKHIDSIMNDIANVFINNIHLKSFVKFWHCILKTFNKKSNHILLKVYDLCLNNKLYNYWNILIKNIENELTYEDFNYYLYINQLNNQFIDEYNNFYSNNIKVKKNKNLIELYKDKYINNEQYNINNIFNDIFIEDLDDEIYNLFNDKN